MARYSKVSTPESKFQVSSAELVLLFRIAVGVTVSMAFSSASLGATASERSEVPETVNESTEAVISSVVSTSVTVRVPDVLSAAAVSFRAAESGPSVITGASLLPVMVKPTVSLAVAPLLSVAVTV